MQLGICKVVCESKQKSNHYFPTPAGVVNLLSMQNSSTHQSLVSVNKTVDVLQRATN